MKSRRASLGGHRTKFTIQTPVTSIRGKSGYQMPTSRPGQHHCASTAGYCWRHAAVLCVLLGLALPYRCSCASISSEAKYRIDNIASLWATQTTSGMDEAGDLGQVAAGHAQLDGGRGGTRRALTQQPEDVQPQPQEEQHELGLQGLQQPLVPPPGPLRPPRPPKPPRPPRNPPSPPPLELKFMPDQPVALPDKCVFVLGTGRSGSTSLMDALNQIPNYLIRGEQMGGFWYLYLAFRLLIQSARRSTQLQGHQRRTEDRYGKRMAGRLDFDTVKTVYEVNVGRHKLPWFNDIHFTRVEDAARLFYLATYGYHSLHVVSGFKEIRFVCGRAFPSHDCRYQDFDYFMRFLRLLCTDVKILLNSRNSSAAKDNFKLGNMLARSGVVNDTAQLEADLSTTHVWFDRYANDHTGAAFRVFMEDMFDPQRNASLARRMLKFLGEDPEATRISFTRMPTWSDPADNGDVADGGGGGGGPKRTKTPVRREPWHLRRRLLERVLRAGGGAAGAEVAAAALQAGGGGSAAVEALLRGLDGVAEDPVLARAALAVLAEAGGEMLGEGGLEEEEEEEGEEEEEEVE